MEALACEGFQWNYQLLGKALSAHGVLAETPAKIWGVFMVGFFFLRDLSQHFGAMEGESPGKQPAPL